MSNLLTGDISYITVQDVRDTSTNSVILGKTDDEITSLIFMSQNVVDTYLKKSRGDRYDCEQANIFPIKNYDCDGLEVSYIPDDIKKATFYIVEYIGCFGVDMSNSGIDYTSEKIGPQAIGGISFNKDVDGLPIPKIAKAILDKRKNRFNHASV